MVKLIRGQGEENDRRSCSMRDKWKCGQIVFEGIFTENFPKLMKDMNLKCLEAHGVLHSRNKTTATSR